jgi:hypothetical protein
MSGKSGSRKKPNPGWFSKGSSPNPGGRPVASPAPQPSAFEVLVEKTLTVTDRAGTREITLEEMLQQQTYQRALKGERMSVREVLKWIMKRDAWLVKHGPKASPPAITRHISPIPTTRMQHFCCSGSRRRIPLAPNLAPTGHNSSLSPGRLKRPSTADGAANA